MDVPPGTASRSGLHHAAVRRRPLGHSGEAVRPAAPPAAPADGPPAPSSSTVTAAIMSYYPSCSVALDPQRYNFANLFYEAVGDQPAGKVLVLASNGYTNTSMAGGTKLFRLQERGLAGVLTDGRLRDFEELAEYDFAAYCTGEATHWGGDMVTPFQVNVPVVVAGVGVLPGQYVYADAAGAVIFQEGEVDEVLKEARKIAAQDEASRARIACEETPELSTGATER